MSLAIKQLQGAVTTKQLWGSLFTKAYLTIVWSVALGIQQPLVVLKRPHLSDYWKIQLLQFYSAFSLCGSPYSVFLFSGVVLPIPGVLNV